MSGGLGEDEVIERIARASASGARADVRVGIGDDAAVLAPPPGHEIVATVDTVVADVHFPAGAAPEDIGYKALAVNLSDLAAMGAEPAWITLALTLDAPTAAWVDAFAAGLTELAAEHGAMLVGGDTTRGPLSVTVQAIGHLPAGSALRRSGARPGQVVCVTGTLGDAALGLELALGQRSDTLESAAWLKTRLARPTPRVQAGQALRPSAGAAIDVSDGFAVDLGRLAAASGCGARIDVDALPASPALAAAVESEARWRCQLGGGDDYELCVALDEGDVEWARQQLEAFSCGLTAVGRFEVEQGVRMCRSDGGSLDIEAPGYRHFA